MFFTKWLDFLNIKYCYKTLARVDFKIIFYAVLIVLNILNYVDRFTVAGILTDIKKEYNIQDAEAGIITVLNFIKYIFLFRLYLLLLIC